jgi:hypothetical protein
MQFMEEFYFVVKDSISMPKRDNSHQSPSPAVAEVAACLDASCLNSIWCCCLGVCVSTDHKLRQESTECENNLRDISGFGGNRNCVLKL